jgi:precorrin-2 dehydrogenase/sirohydrochlorin ferrochelatase
MDSFPAFLPLAGKRVVVAGDGEAAASKARLFAPSPAELVRIPEATAADASAYAGALIAFIAIDDPALAEAAARAARGAGALVNVVDRPALSDFSTPALVLRGPVVAAIATGGAAPILATRLREDLEARWPEGLAHLAALFADMREPARARFPDPTARRAALRRLLDGPAAEAALAGDLARARDLALAQFAEATRPPGRVIPLACPPEPDLLTLRDLRALSTADVIVADNDIPPAILSHARRDAPIHPFTTEAALLALAKEGATVVHLLPPPQRGGRGTIGRRADGGGGES